MPVIDAGVAARILRGAWRVSPPACEATVDELKMAEPLLLRSGAGALAWRAIRERKDLAASKAGRRLHESFRLHALQHSVLERRIAEALAALRGAGIDPILIKGWDAARLYPAPGLRPFGDVDLWLSPGERKAAGRVIAGLAPGPVIDLDHTETAGPDESGMRQAARTVMLGSTPVRVLSAEDHLGVLAVHFMKHGGWRSLWLCDLAAAVESCPPSFDWERCLSTDARRREWIQCALSLSDLIGADLSAVPLGRFASPPSWIAASMLAAWERPNPSSLATLPPRRRPIALARVAATRWRSPLEVVYRRGLPLRDRPPRGGQAIDFGWRALKRLALPRRMLDRVPEPRG
ncbi:MAG TPA: nucleotidyltransferase family protein [Actinomycetota bacterium]